MCIALLTTAHPSYALIILNNRDEFILRPTSRPHWFSSHGQEILSARDLQRSERGTWLGITKKGKLAILTNFRENDEDYAAQSSRSRGAMALAWLTSSDDESTEDFVHRLLKDDGLRGVGGFSLVCGLLRKHGAEEMGPLAIVSNRRQQAKDLPRIADQRDQVYGLSNTTYNDPVTWPKVESGKKKLLETVKQAVEQGLAEQEMIEGLFAILDTDTMPPHNGEPFAEYLNQVRKSIFIPMIRPESPANEMPKVEDIAAAEPLQMEESSDGPLLSKDTRPVNGATFIGGTYGTQRQSIILVRWDGHVVFKERSLYDEQGHPIEKGAAEFAFEFDIEGWN